MIKLYPFADAVVIFSARTLAFVRALAFWEVFPSTRNSSQSVQCLAVENGMKLVRETSFYPALLSHPLGRGFFRPSRSRMVPVREAE